MDNGGAVYIEQEVIDKLHSFRQYEAANKESGGFLVGYYKGLDLHVIGITTPQPKDNQSRHSFHRRDINHVKQVSSWYRQSRGAINCLGEWHTHPEPLPKPSSIDIRGWNLFVKNRNGQKAIFLIVGTAGIWVGSHLVPKAPTQGKYIIRTSPLVKK